MLEPHAPKDIAELVAKCEQVAASLRELRAFMVDPGPTTIELNRTKAENAIDHVQQWANTCLRKHEALRREMAKTHARQKRKELATRSEKAKK